MLIFMKNSLILNRAKPNLFTTFPELNFLTNFISVDEIYTSCRSKVVKDGWDHRVGNSREYKENMWDRIWNNPIEENWLTLPILDMYDSQDMEFVMNSLVVEQYLMTHGLFNAVPQMNLDFFATFNLDTKMVYIHRCKGLKDELQIPFEAFAQFSKTMLEPISEKILI